MTMVNTETGEMLDILSEVEAERLTTRISLKLDAMADTYAGVMPLIREAIDRQAFVALGYQSLGQYVSDRFGGALDKLGIDVRREVVRELTSAGMSTRAIAPLVGVHHDTVARDARRVVHTTPEPPQAEEVAPSPSPVRDVESTPTVVGATPAPRSAVVGLDGKTYARPAPRLPKPVLDGEAAEYDNAEQSCRSLARAVSKLLEFEHPNMRAGMRRYWAMASEEVPPAPRADVNPEQMRAAAHGLLILADEWNS